MGVLIRGQLVTGLRDNPFCVLEVTPRSSKSDIHDAVEDARLDAEGGVEEERRLEIARQALIAPNERLRAEVGYLLELRPADARKALRSKSFDQWIEIASSAVGLAKLNALVEALSLARSIEPAKAALMALVDGWKQIDPKPIVTRINEERSVAGFGEAQLADVRMALEELRQSHAARALQGVSQIVPVHAMLSDLLSADLVPSHRTGEAFVSALLESYGKLVSGALASSEDRALSSLAAFCDSGSDEEFAKFEKDLQEWDAIAQPLQLVSEAFGADEAHSKELYVRVRSKAIDLANDEDRHHDALRITRLSARVFAELPWAKEALEKDARDLDEIIANTTRSEFLLPLASALEAAREDLAATSRQLSTHGFSAITPMPVGAVWKAYAGLLSNDVDEEVRGIGANMVRNLAITLFNDRQDASQAHVITTQLSADARWFPKEMRDRIAEDDSFLDRSLKLDRLLDAMKRGQWKRSKEMCSALMLSSPASELDNLRKIETLISEKLRARTKNIVVWGGIGAVVLGLIISDGGSGSSSNETAGYDDTYTANSYDPVTSAGNDITVEMPSADPAEALEEESPPPLYGSEALSLAELRYCLRQSERIDLARNLAVNYSQQSRLNSAVSDFNSRCGSFRYRQEDMAIAQAEIGGMMGTLRSDARSMVGADDGPESSPLVSPPGAQFEGSQSLQEDATSTEEPSDPYDTSVEDY